ncbi:3-phosphoshikimate 1-carboxyvinyltransferase [Falsiroseomonas tokyonensis]|uniref:5-enolpyruvylshikimate-3-phosphate synthase n=1 Tax=Falsiroseomonas tokyonensis TaxID=430521 RepID=A0ABV7BSI4_9PROT|nr:3-phosphoshikimate 1-carboxyvinyltransferase [Falsiroseomonas tokyonensis]MBU8536998.1 3-phosphoshikimate 1-carboxyvinyltransferase [Falsiroseomonas tokyonensis]
MQASPEIDQLPPRGGPHGLRATPPGRPLAGRIALPGDPFIGQVALMLAALAAGTSSLTGLVETPELRRTAAALRALGARVESLGAGSWQVAGRGIGGLVEPAEVLELGPSSLAATLFCGLLAGHPVFAVLTGEAALRRHPMHQVTQPLTAIGARFTSSAGGRLPLAVEGAADPLPIDHRLARPSAPVKAALLLAGLCARGTTRLAEAVATPDHAEHLLRQFGAELRVAPEGVGQVIELLGQPELRAAEVAVPGDAAAAAFPAVAALLVPGSAITLTGLGLNPLRTGLFAALHEMGAELAEENVRMQAGERVADLSIRASALTGLDLPAERAAGLLEDYPLLAVAAAGARGTTRLRGLAALRGAEGERLAATAAMLAANGVACSTEGEDVIIEGLAGPPAGGGLLRGAVEPRLAMAALVLGLAARQPVRVEEAHGIETEFPGFAALFNRLAGADAMVAA